jgi:hypothetical protein
MTTATAPAGTVRATVYAEFLNGYGGPSLGEDWGVDLGRPIHYSKHGTVFRQDFDRGLSLANVGDVPVCIDLGGTYRDLDGVLRTSLTLPAGAGDVLLLEAPLPRQDAR